LNDKANSAGDDMLVGILPPLLSQKSAGEEVHHNKNPTTFILFGLNRPRQPRRMGQNPSAFPGYATLPS
jgi:hypothetical protein